MKIFKLSSLSLLALAISFLACQKELSIENGGTSLGTLKSDVTGDCLPSTVNGVFKADSLLSNSNYIEVQVDVSAIGFYQIKSDTINGYSFKGQGNFGVTGLNTVRLYPTGKPIAAGVNSFTIQYGANTCNVDITVVGVGTTIAIYTLGGAPGQCTTPQINGIYKVGTALDASNTIQVTVNVTTPGVYSFGATSTPPGLTFAAAGNFTTTGPQQVTLSAVGTPTLAGNIPVTVSNLVNTCTFTMPVIAAGGGGGTAVFTLNNAAGVCSGAVLGAGTYNTGVALTATNTVTLMATVVTAGTYTITVASVNGYTFTGSGTFTGTGPQPIVLTGTGTPAAPGANNFTATASTSSCTFSITVTGTAPPVNLDYIPETVGSN
ncbi:MAG: hypothetical protein ABIY51_07865 [Ferruginibacter sp.]